MLPGLVFGVCIIAVSLILPCVVLMQYQCVMDRRMDMPMTANTWLCIASYLMLSKWGEKISYQAYFIHVRAHCANVD